MTTTELTDRIDRIDRIVADLPRPGAPDGVQGAVVRVEVPATGFVHEAAAGGARADTGEPMTARHRFHVASVGKMMTATLVLRAADTGLFGPRHVDTPLGDLAMAPTELVHGLHPQGHRITLRHLLTHTSGLRDIQVDDADATADELGRPAPGSVIAGFTRSAQLLAAGDTSDLFARHRWTPWDPDRPLDPMGGMLNRYLASGSGTRPLGPPGARFHYSDSGYVLLGVLLEAATGRRYHELQRDWIAQPLGLTHTYLAYHDDPVADARRHEMDIWLGDVPLLSTGLDVSLDWSGGGQVSTAADLCHFLRALLGGDLHVDPATTAAVAQWQVPEGLHAPFLGIGLGLLRWQAGRHTVVGHAGAWGVRVFHDPASGAVAAGTVGRRDDCTWLADVLDAVHDTAPRRPG